MDRLQELQSMSDDELNELVAKMVMKWAIHEKDGVKRYYDLEGYTGYKNDNWNPTTDMNDATQLVDIFGSWQLTKMGMNNPDREYRAIVNKNHHVAYASNGARAITIAAILAKEGRE